jgi:hypothetical protein
MKIRSTLLGLAAIGLAACATDRGARQETARDEDRNGAPQDQQAQQQPGMQDEQQAQQQPGMQDEQQAQQQPGMQDGQQAQQQPGMQDGEAEQTIVGTVERLEQERLWVRDEQGELVELVVPDGVDTTELREGQDVRATWNEQDGDRVVQEVTPIAGGRG